MSEIAAGSTRQTMPARRIVFYGDIITDCGQRDDPDRLGAGYVRQLAEGPLAGHQVINAGISGNRVVDLQQRVADDVLAAQPDLVSILIGINDTWRRFDRADPTTTETYARGYRDILARISDTGARLVMMEPFLLPVTDEQQSQWRADLDGKITAMRGLADEFDATLVPTDVFLTETAAADESRGNQELAHDGVHPTPYGHSLIAELWERTVRVE